MKKSVLYAGLVEIGIVGILVLVISVTLNYFNIIPLSDTFSFLSFLPRQERNLVSKQIGESNNKNANRVDNKLTRLIVTPDSPQELINKNEKGYSFQSIKQSWVKVKPNSELKLDLKMSLTEAKADENISGLIFTDKLSKEAKSLVLFYYPNDKTWNLKFQQGDVKKFYALYEINNNDLNIEISISISGDGKVVSTYLSNGSIKKFQLPESIYEDSNQIGVTLQSAPTASVKVSSLSYTLQ